MAANVIPCKELRHLKGIELPNLITLDAKFQGTINAIAKYFIYSESAQPGDFIHVDYDYVTFKNHIILI